MSQIIVDGVFSQDLYQQYSPIYFTVSYILALSTVFASISAVVIHSICKLTFTFIKNFTENVGVRQYGTVMTYCGARVFQLQIIAMSIHV